MWNKLTEPLKATTAASILLHILILIQYTYASLFCYYLKHLRAVCWVSCVYLFVWKINLFDIWSISCLQDEHDPFQREAAEHIVAAQSSDATFTGMLYNETYYKKGNCHTWLKIYITGNKTKWTESKVCVLCCTKVVPFQTGHIIMKAAAQLLWIIHPLESRRFPSTT